MYDDVLSGPLKERDSTKRSSDFAWMIDSISLLSYGENFLTSRRKVSKPWAAGPSTLRAAGCGGAVVQRRPSIGFVCEEGASVPSEGIGLQAALP